MGVNVFSTKYLFYVSYWRRDGHFARSSKPHQGLVVYREKTVPSFLRYFKTLSLGQDPGNQTHGVPLCRKAFQTSDWANHVAVQIKGIHFSYLYSEHFITLGEMNLRKKTPKLLKIKNQAKNAHLLKPPWATFSLSRTLEFFKISSLMELCQGSLVHFV